MNEDQLRQFLKNNLDISIIQYSPYGTDDKRIIVELRLGGELISNDHITI